MLVNIIEHLKIKPKYIINTLIVFIILNSFWLIAEHWVFVFRPYFNYDYLLALMLAPFSVIASVIILVLSFLLELLINNALIFHFNDIIDFIRTIQFASELSIQAFLKSEEIILLVSFLFIGVLTLRYIKDKTNLLASIIVLLLAFVADLFNGSSYLIESQNRLISRNISGSSALNIYISLNDTRDPKTFPIPLEKEEILLSKDEVLNWYETHREKSVLFVIVESYGLNNDSLANDWLYNQLITSEIIDTYNIRYGKAYFEGATTSSELRYLCALKGSYNSILTPENTTDCIPRAFTEKGYPVIGGHGFTKNLFLRETWWDKIGISQRLFVDDFNSIGAPYCGSGFIGTCDDFIIHHLKEKIEEQPGFYYHLTLNTHPPIVKTIIPIDLGEICNNLKVTKEACTLNAKIGEYLRSLSEVLSSLSEKPLVFLVGDHAPSFERKASRTFSPLETPYFILMPKF